MTEENKKMEKIEDKKIKEKSSEKKEKESKENSKILEKKEKPVENNKKASEKISEKKEVKEKNIENKIEDKKIEKKKKETPKIKKIESVVRGFNLPISTKQSVAICKFIKWKKIENAILDLEQVKVGKKAVPMKGEIPHRKGKIMSGRFPKNSAIQFINLLKTLKSNSDVDGVENPIIIEAIANIAPRPLGKFGRVQRKRTHVKIVAKDKSKLKKLNKKTKKK